MSTVKLSEVIAPNYYEIARDILNHNHTHYDLSGGRGSLKSSFISLIVPIIMMQSDNKVMHAAVFRKVGKTVRNSVYAQYIWALNRLGVSQYWQFKVSPLELVYKPTGQSIMFSGLDDANKEKSIKAPFGYIAITHFEEKDQFAGRREIRTTLQSTMRGGDDFWNFESYNPPISRDNWANRDSLEERADRLCHKSTYLQAPPEWLGEQFLSEAEYVKATDERAYRHEYLGEAIGTGGNVFENVVEQEITDEQINNFDRVCIGVDWGYYPDPWAFNRVQYEPALRTLYIFDEMHANKAGNLKTAEMIKSRGITGAELVIADSAEPKSVYDYRDFGINCIGADKPPGSVDYSMQWLQGLSKIVIDRRRCPHTYEEFTQYEYERNKDDEIISGYPDINNHHIDAVRYATNRIWMRSLNTKKERQMKKII